MRRGRVCAKGLLQQRRWQGRDETTLLPQIPSHGKKGTLQTKQHFQQTFQTLQNTLPPPLCPGAPAPAWAGLEEELVFWSRASTEPWEFAGRRRTRKTTQNCCKVPQLCLTPHRRGRANTTLLCPKDKGEAARAGAETAAGTVCHLTSLWRDSATPGAQPHRVGTQHCRARAHTPPLGTSRAQVKLFWVECF